MTMADADQQSLATNRPSKKRPRPSHRRRRLRELERDAARRTLNGNGMNGSLPPLPGCDDDEDDGDDGGGECSDSGGAGFGTLFGHPYGALPYGNIHLAAPPQSVDGATTAAAASAEASAAAPWHPDIVRHRGLGPYLRLLNDEQLLAIFSYVDGTTLAGGIASTSQFLYVAGHHEELWRDLVLRRWGDCGFEVPDPSVSEDAQGEEIDEKEEDRNRNESGKEDDLSKKQNNGCWKDIYAHNHYSQQKSQSQTSPSNKPAPPAPKRHVPISVHGIYSDTFFRSFLCRSFALRPSWLAAHTVPTLPHAEVTTHRFLTEYEEKNRPLLIKGASQSWPALHIESSHKWNAKYLTKVSQGKTFRATSGAAPLAAKFTMGDYLNYCASSTEEAPLYLFDRTFAAKCPQLLQDFDGALKESCPWWSRGNVEAGHDLFSVLGEEGRPDYQWLIVGPKRSGSCFHIDPNCTHAWNAPIIGKKRWIFYPPGVTPPGVFPSPSGDDVCMPISIGEWFLTFWDAHVERRSDPDVRKRPLECTACPGDVLFVPHGWWHMVMNIGDDDVGTDDGRGMSVALTRNYVSASNLSDVLRFLDTRVSHISGCRDRAEAVPPKELGKEFRKALLSVMEEEDSNTADCHDGEEKKCDESSRGGSGRRKWADLLEKSEERAKEGWGCDAWVDLPSIAADGCTNASNASCSIEDSGRNEKKSTGTSILARAKGLSDKKDSSLSIGGSAGTSSGGGFSFSFL